MSNQTTDNFNIFTVFIRNISKTVIERLIHFVFIFILDRNCEYFSRCRGNDMQFTIYLNGNITVNNIETNNIEQIGIVFTDEALQNLVKLVK